ncbi:MAG: hypothetical protein ACI3XJ_12620 [Oscillospiraceae bacterium]
MKHRTETYDSTYVFSAEQQKEVKEIYQRYLPQEEGKGTPSAEEEKLERLRKLDHSVTRYASTAALLDGVIGAAVHGAGISLVQGKDLFVSGTVIAVVGLILFLLAYPIYSCAAKKRRRKVEAEIIKLCEELMK